MQRPQVSQQNLRAPFAMSMFLTVVTSAASAQTLTWDTISQSMTTTGLHGTHARPLAWKPFFIGGQATMDIHWDYDVIISNSSSSRVDFRLELLESVPHIVSPGCWGTDPGTTPQGDLTGSVVGLGSTRVTGSGLFESDYSVGISACPWQQNDGVHSSGGSYIFAGPSFAGGATWYVSAIGGQSSALTYADQGTVLTDNLEVWTRHELPILTMGNGCDPLVPNASGASGELEAFGLVDGMSPSVVLHATSLPPNVVGFFAMGTALQPATQTGWGVSTLCLGGGIYRWLGSLGSSSADGTFGVALEMSDLPIPGGSILPGDTWHFQFFHRDTDLATGLATANSTSAISLTF